MNNRDLYNSPRGFLAANAVIGSAASKMADLNRQEAARIAEISRFYSHYLSEKQLAERVGQYILSGNLIIAFEFLNESLKREIIHDCQNQKEFKTHLSILIDERRKKYLHFYEKIGMDMPENLAQMTAEQICSIMSVELMSAEELNEYHSQREDAEWSRKFAENLGLAFRIILITGLIILMICLSAQ